MRAAVNTTIPNATGSCQSMRSAYSAQKATQERWQFLMTVHWGAHETQELRICRVWVMWRLGGLRSRRGFPGIDSWWIGACSAGSKSEQEDQVLEGGKLAAGSSEVPRSGTLSNEAPPQTGQLGATAENCAYSACRFEAELRWIGWTIPDVRLRFGMRIVLALILFSCWFAQLVCLAQTTTSSSSAKTSVRPGINTEYRKPDLDVTQWVERFEREGREIFDHRQAIVDALNLRSGMVVADVGAGTGLFTLLFGKSVGNRGRVFAVDIVRDFLKYVETEAGKAGLQNIRTVLCTESSVELASESIDLAFICDAYHHFEYPRQTMQSLHGALRPGGQLIVIEFKRIEGESSDWILQHVRAGQEVFTREIEAIGFRKETELDLLKDNYFLRFTKN